MNTGTPQIESSVARYEHGVLKGMIPNLDTCDLFDMQEIGNLREMTKSPGWVVMEKIIAAERVAIGLAAIDKDCEEAEHRRFQGDSIRLTRLSELAKEVERVFDSMCALHKKTEEGKQNG